MTIWDSYPPTYRRVEIERILQAVRAGECAALIGLSGTGKSNLFGFLANRVRQPDLPEFLLLDCNRLPSPDAAGLFALLADILDHDQTELEPSLRTLERQIANRLQANPASLCLLLDRFDAFPQTELEILSGNLRSLRDAFKYALTFVIATRRPVPDDYELAELFFAHTTWLGPLNEADACWSIDNYAERKRVSWSHETVQSIFMFSAGYPSILRAVCEAHSLGCPLEQGTLRQHPAVRRRIEEFWLDQPSPADLERSGLANHPLLISPADRAARRQIDLTSLTAAENRLWLYFQAHPGEVCGKDDLIRAVWSEEAFLEGTRDDSLAQLIRRLRLKIETDPSNPLIIQTLPGRGYRYTNL